MSLYNINAQADTSVLSFLTFLGYYAIKEKKYLKGALVICFFPFICLKWFPARLL